MRFFKPCLQATRFCASCLLTLGCWTLWLALSVLLAIQVHIATSNELAVPPPVLRALEERLALSGVKTTFGRATFDPSGRILLENVTGSLKSFPEPVFMARSLYVRCDLWSLIFLGRFDEPRKGMAVLLAALPALVERFGEIEILVVGRGDEDELREQADDLAGHLRFLGQVDDATKASALRSADVYCAPNTGGESFGIVLVEAMAAGTPVVASNLDAFRRVLEDGAAGLLVPIEDPGALAEAVVTVLTDDTLRAGNVAAASEAVRQYDWQVVADDITMVYETVAGSGVRVVVGT
jgi:glycosyltransferase involved in cell wall biosynthesis